MCGSDELNLAYKYKFSSYTFHHSGRYDIFTRYIFVCDFLIGKLMYRVMNRKAHPPLHVLISFICGMLFKASDATNKEILIHVMVAKSYYDDDGVRIRFLTISTGT